MAKANRIVTLILCLALIFSVGCTDTTSPDYPNSDPDPNVGTALPPDQDGLTVISTTPEDSATGVAVDTEIRFTFNQDINLVDSNRIDVMFFEGGVNHTVVLSNDNTLVIAADLKENTEYVIVIGEDSVVASNNHDVKLESAYLFSFFTGTTVPVAKGIIIQDSVDYDLLLRNKVGVDIEWNMATMITDVSISGEMLAAHSTSGYLVDDNRLVITQPAIQGANPKEQDILKVEVTFDEGYDSFNINVKSKAEASQVISVLVITQPKLDYSEEMALDLSSLVVQLVWSNETVQQVGYADFGTNDITVGLNDGTILTVENHNQPVEIKHTSSGETAKTDKLIVVSSLELRDFAYLIYDGKATITDYKGTGGDVAIPAELDGYPVNAIGSAAFEHKGLTSIVIPDSITTIGDFAFEANLLTILNIPNSVTSIGIHAFNYNQLTSANIPPSVISIGDWAFENIQRDPAELTIYGISGSTAEIYANENGHIFNAFSDLDEDDGQGVRPFVTDVVDNNLGVKASATIGKDSPGKVTITANNMGKSWHAWSVKVFRRSLFNEGSLQVDINNTSKTINITLARGGPEWGDTLAGHDVAGNEAKIIAAAINSKSDLFIATVTKSGRITEGDGLYLAGGENVELTLTWSEEVWLKDRAGFALECIAATSVDHINGTTSTTLSWNDYGKIEDGNKLFISEDVVIDNREAANLQQTLEFRSYSDFNGERGIGPFVSISRVGPGAKASATIGSGSPGKLTVKANYLGDAWNDWHVHVFRRSWSLDEKGLSVNIDKLTKKINITLARNWLGGSHDNSNNEAQNIAAAINRATDLFRATVTKSGRITEGDGIYLSGGKSIEFTLTWSEAVWFKDKAGFKLDGVTANRVNHVDGTKLTTLIWNDSEKIKDGNHLYVAARAVENYARVANLEQPLERRFSWEYSAVYDHLTVEFAEPAPGVIHVGAMSEGVFVYFGQQIKVLEEHDILLIANAEAVEIKSSISYNQLKIIPQASFDYDTEYTVVVGVDAVGWVGDPKVKLESAYEFSFTFAQAEHARPYVLDVAEANLGGVASATIGKGSPGKVTITANNVGEPWNWSVRVFRRSWSLFSNKPLEVTINESKKIIDITLARYSVAAGFDGHDNFQNKATTIANAINMKTDLFTATATIEGNITEGDGISLSGGENIELTLTWSEAVWLKNKAGFQMEGLAATSVDVVNGTTTTLIWNGSNVGYFDDINQLYIATGTVENEKRFENLEKILQRIAIDGWK